MVSISNVTASQAGAYYVSGKDNYYTSAQGQWAGRGAEALGLSGPIDRTTFERVLSGKDPAGKQIVSTNSQGQHRAALDLTFSAPKSVSILAEVMGRDDVRQAHENAVFAALSYIEKNLAQCRHSESGKTQRVDSKNLVIARFAHDTSRELDPQCHSHAVILNATQDPSGAWKALSNEEIYISKMLIGQVYRSELASNLRELGFALHADHRGFFEVAGVDKSLIEHFSRRSVQIHEKVQELKAIYPDASASKLREMACLGSREAKKDMDITVVRAAWTERLSMQGYSRESILETVHEAAGKARQAEAERTEVKLSEYGYIHLATKALTEQESVFSREDVLKTAAKLAIGEYRIADLERAFNDVSAGKQIVTLSGTEGKFTTREMQRIERNIVHLAKTGRDAVSPVLSADRVCHVITDKYHGLTNDQKDAVQHILTATDRAVGVQGDAGTGKTTMLSAVRSEVEAQGLSIRGMTYTGKATQELANGAGIQSQTLHSFLAAFDRQSVDIAADKGKEVWVIDEASMVGSRQLYELMRAAKKAQARIVLVGDVKQLQSIEAGKMFYKLQESGAMKTLQMSETIRQKDADYKDIVTQIASKRIEQAFDKMELTGKIHEIKDRQSRLMAITEAYARTKHHNTLVVTSRNQDRNELNRLIRASLKAQGKLKGEEHTFQVRESKGLNPVERYFGQSYAVGDVVVVNSGKSGIKVGAQGKVTGIDQGTHEITVDINGKGRTIDLRKDADKIAVYHEKQASFVAGDKIIFLKNDKSLHVKNGQTAEVKSTDDRGNITARTDSKKEISFNINSYGYIDHGYCVSTYKSQGQTSREVIFHGDTTKEASYNAFYVALTRGRDDVHIFTDSKEVLQAAVKHEQTKSSTLDYDKSLMEKSQHENHETGHRTLDNIGDSKTRESSMKLER